jgi:hypothetical protein
MTIKDPSYLVRQLQERANFIDPTGQDRTTALMLAACTFIREQAARIVEMEHEWRKQIDRIVELEKLNNELTKDNELYDRHCYRYGV